MPTDSSSAPAISRPGAAARATGLALAYAATVTALALPVGIGYFAFQHWAAGLSLQETTLHLEDALLILQAAAAILGMLGAFAWVKFFLQRFDRVGNLAPLGLSGQPRGWLRFAVSMIAGAVAAVVTIGLALLSGSLRLSLEHWQVEGGVDVALDVAGALTIVLCSVIGEELVFRGYAVWALRRAWPIPVAFLISALLFTGFRAVMAPFSLVVLLNALAIGLLLAVLVDRAGGLSVSIGARFGWATVIGVICSLPSGGTTLEGVLTSARFPGITMDYSFGPEGTWITLGLFGVILAAVAVILTRRRH